MKVSEAVIEFMSINVNDEFTSAQLHEYVLAAGAQGSASSIDRVLRGLRQSGKVNYTLVSRQKSRYRSLPVLETSVGQN